MSAIDRPGGTGIPAGGVGRSARRHELIASHNPHRRQIMEKADTYTVAGLVRYALREGVTTLDRE
jgi:hypothetical protein